MSSFSNNLKKLRGYKKQSQALLADELDLKRSTLSAYENGSAEPNLTTLLRIADHFKISLDRLLRQDITQLTDFELKRIENGYDLDIRGQHLRILATTVDRNNDELTELIPQKAKAGYTAGYSDPDFIKELPQIQLPFLSNTKKHRVFPISGDSMPPVSDGSFVVGQYIDDWTSLKEHVPCIVITKDDGIVFKIISNQLEAKAGFTLYSTNPLYEPYFVHAREVLEIWKFVHYISSDLPTPQLNQEQITTSLLKLQREVEALKSKG